MKPTRIRLDCARTIPGSSRPVEAAPTRAAPRERTRRRLVMNAPSLSRPRGPRAAGFFFDRSGLKQLWRLATRRRHMGFPQAAAARSLKRWIFPVAVFGSSGTKVIQRGYLYGASLV